jgi:hypothetical protein
MHILRKLSPRRVLVPTLAVLALASCQKKITMDHSVWDSAKSKNLPKFVDREWSSRDKVTTLVHQIEFKDQMIANIPVEGTYVKFVKDRNGVAKYIEQNRLRVDSYREGAWIPIIEAYTPKASIVGPSLKSQFSALKTLTFERAALVFVYGENSLQLIWRSLAFDSKGVGWLVDTDLDVTKYQMRRAGSSFHETTATVYPQGPKRSALQDVVIKNLSEIENLVSPELKLTTATIHKIKDSEDILRFDPPDERFDQVQVFFTVTKALEWFRERLGVSLSNSLEVQVHVGYPEKTNTSFYYQGRIRIGAGDGVNYDKIPMDPSIATHEAGHAIVEALTRLPYENEGGSINEALADFFAAVQLDNPNMGEVAYLKGPFRRTVANPMRWTAKTGGLYHDSAIVSGLLWDLKKELGVDKTLDLVLKTLARVTPSTDFQDFQNKLYFILKQELSGESRVKIAGILREREWPEL